MIKAYELAVGIRKSWSLIYILREKNRRQYLESRRSLSRTTGGLPKQHHQEWFIGAESHRKKPGCGKIIVLCISSFLPMPPEYIPRMGINVLVGNIFVPVKNTLMKLIRRCCEICFFFAARSLVYMERYYLLWLPSFSPQIIGTG